MIVWPVPPLIPVFGPVANHQEHTTILRGYNHLVQQTEGERVVPVKFFEDRNDRPHQARLADPRFADDRHHLASTTAGKVQHAAELLKLDLAPYEARQPPSSGDLEASPRRAGAGHFIDLQRPG